MRARGAYRLMAVGLFTMVVACGGDDGGSDDGDGDGIDDDGGDGGDGSDTTLDQLSDAEAAELCDAATEDFSPEVFVEFSCYVIAIVSNPEDVEACEAQFADCLETSEPTPGQEFTCWVDPDLVTVLPDCAGDITAGDLQACWVASVDQILDLFDSITCETAFEDLPEDFTTYELPEECAALQEACPELFGAGA